MIKRRTITYQVTHVAYDAKFIKPIKDKPMTKADWAILAFFIFSVSYFVWGITH